VLAKKFNCKACGGVHYSVPELMECHRKHKKAEKMKQEAPKKYRKKPVVVEAIKWTGENFEEIVNLIGNPEEVKQDRKAVYDESDMTLKIKTLEGTMTAKPGNYIIKGVAGEFYPCKPDIFEATYISEEEYQKEKAKIIVPEILATENCFFILPVEVCPEELRYLSPGQYAELRIRGFMSKKGFEVDTVEHSR